MPTIKKMVERLIELGEQGIYKTLLAVCPNSEAVLEAAVRVAAQQNCPMLFAATLNQIDRDGGYTGWTPQLFVTKMWHYAEKYQCHAQLYPCLDHGGQWLKDSHTRDQLSYETTTTEIKASITAMLEAGYVLLHLDATVDRTHHKPLPIEVVVERSLDLIAHAEDERQRLALEEISYEVGTEEVQGGLVNLTNFEKFLRLLHGELEKRDLQHLWPAFVVAQVGTNLHTTTFDAEVAHILYRMVSPYGSLVKGHYTDWVQNPAAYPLVRMGGANVGPEFTGVEFEALLTLEATEHERVAPPLRSHFNYYLTEAVEASHRWKKWLQPEEIGKSLHQLAPERQQWLVKTGARYVWTVPTVIAARQQLYDNLQPILPDPHQYVLDQIAACIERYVLSFGLSNSLQYFS
jgi:D-tagatose-1,6-bisphosphate aldolase subunit GatZ/KbaZ